MPSVAPRLTLAADAAVDLQMHTTYSDGVWTPEQLLEYLASEGFGLAAITDHDRVDTSAALHALAAQKQVSLLTAAEMSTSWRGELTDVLCYGFDPAKGNLRALAQEVRRRQTENTREICENLGKIGIALPQAEREALLMQPSARQPQALLDLLRKYGYGTGETSPVQMIDEGGFCWATNDLAAVVEATHQGGGVCLIAHPGRGGDYTRFDAALLDELRQETPIDGFEVYYPAHSPEQMAMYVEYARQHDLLISSGSDSHGPEKKPIKYEAALSRRLLERLGVQMV